MIDLFKGHSVFGDVTKFMYFVGQDTQENEINFRKD